MKRAYVVMGELEDTEQVDYVEPGYKTMEDAEERCATLERHPDNNHIWYWREVIVDEEGN